jgi:hypothetical protein
MARRPPEPDLVLFLDENLDGDTVVNALRAALESMLSGA